jgi:hypothetical protein
MFSIELYVFGVVYVTLPLSILNGHEIKKLLAETGTRSCIEKFQYWPSGARTANGTAQCH